MATISTRKLALESCTLLAARGTRARLHIGPARLTRVSLRPALTRITRHHSTVVPSIPPEDSYDIVIIGGANAGLALACALLTKPSIRQTTRILLLEGGSLDRVRHWNDKGDWENRVSSLTAENVTWLKSIGAWKHIAQHRPCEVEEMVIWANPDPSSSPSIHFPPLGHPMAYMTENTNLQRALLRRIDELNPGTFTLLEGPSARVASMHPDPAGGGRWVGLRLSDASERWVRGGVVVGADGPNSPVRKYSNIESFGHSYDTHGLVATLEHDPSALYPNNTAFQRFLPTGPLAWLPLDERNSTMVWSTRPDHAAAYKRLSSEALVSIVNAGYSLPESTLAELNAAILAADVAGTPLSADAIRTHLSSLSIPYNDNAILPPTVRAIPAKSVASFPLRLSHAESYLGAPGTRTVLVGDAAHTTHPLAGQGLNMGLADVRALADAWEDARRVGGDLGSVTSMAPYPRTQYPANQLLLNTVDTLHHVFRNRSGLMNWARGMGLDVINELGPLKRLLMQGAGAVSSKTTDSRGKGWPHAAATGLEGWLGAKKVIGQALGMAGQVVAQTIARGTSKGK